MKKTSLKVAMAMVILSSAVIGNGYTASATTSKPVATQVPAEAPIMRDNLFKFGLKKEVELPVTVTAGGLSYTLEKMMVYDVKSKDAQALIKKYGYIEKVALRDTKYMVWTKITIKNNSQNLIQLTSKSPSMKWTINVNSLTLNPSMPKLKVNEFNSKEALWNWKLEPGKELSTYQMFGALEDFSDLYIFVNYGGYFDEKAIVKRQGE